MSFDFPGALSCFDITAKRYLAANPTIDILVVGALVFSSHGQVLLLQRSPTNFVPYMWETPGGKCEPDSGETILEALSRELHEETGLRMTKIIRLVDDKTEFDAGSKGTRKRWRKLTFHVEVELSRDEEDVDFVKFDPAEHQAWVWASREEVTSETKDSMDMIIGYSEQKAVILDAFEQGHS